MLTVDIRALSTRMRDMPAHLCYCNDRRGSVSPRPSRFEQVSVFQTSGHDVRGTKERCRSKEAQIERLRGTSGMDEIAPFSANKCIFH